MIDTISINGVDYNIARASAVKQKTLMTLIGARITLNSATSGIEEIDIPMLKGVLLTVGEETLDKIADIVLWKCVRSGSTELINVNNFQSGMNDYFTLLAEAIKFNLQDFFCWLNGENKKMRVTSNVKNTG